MADFQQFYGLDLGELWKGGLSVRRALLLSEQLLDIDDSRYLAAVSGGRQFIGWGHDRILAADVRDLLVIILNGLGGSATPPSDMYPRPKVPVPKQAKTIAEFNTGAFMRWLMS